MKIIKNKFNILPICLIVSLILGAFSSYVNFGFFSVFFSVALPVLLGLNLVLLFIGLIKKKYLFSTGVFVFFICFNFPYKGFKIKNHDNTDSISMLSFNVRVFNMDNDINKKNIADEITDFIATKNADILCIQESAELISNRKIKYPYKFSGIAKNKTLLEIHSKYPILKTGHVTFPNTLNNAIFADVLINKDTLRLYNIHLQSFGIELNSDKENTTRLEQFFSKMNIANSKQNFQANLIKERTNKCDKKLIIAGDFNSTPFSLSYRNLKKGLNDSFLSKGFGLGSTYSLFNYPLRLDYFLVDPRLEINSHENYNLNLSDHEPILMNFKFSSGKTNK